MQDGYYWTFDETAEDVVAGSKRAMSTKFPGVPTDVEAAVRLNDGYMYFFKGERLLTLTLTLNQLNNAEKL